MSRSKKKTPKLGYSNAESEKEDKRIANRNFRRKSKEQIRTGKEPVTDMNEIITKWDMSKDDKQYIKHPKAKQMRK